MPIFAQNNFFTIYTDAYNKFIEEFNEVNSSIVEESSFLQSKEELLESLKNRKVIQLYNYYIKDPEYFIFSNDELFSNNKIKLRFYSSDCIKKNIVFCTHSKINKKKIIGFLGSKKIDSIKLDNFNLKIVDNENVNLYVSHLSLQSSFSLVYKNNEIFFLSDFDFFNKITKRVTNKNRGEDDLISEFSQLSFGDLIVHMDHGIGRFNGIRNSDVNGFTQDFIELIYHNNDKLLIPIENLELISRYGSNEKNVQLDKLGSKIGKIEKHS